MCAENTRRWEFEFKGAKHLFLLCKTIMTWCESQTAFSDYEKSHCGVLATPPLPEPSELYSLDAGEPGSLQPPVGGAATRDQATPPWTWADASADW